MNERLSTINLSTLYKELKVPENIIRHMTKVAAICLFLSEKLNIGSNKELLIAALCHDVMKLNAADHEEAAGQYFQDRGFDEIAAIIRKHKYTSLIEKDKIKIPTSLKEKILYYADKRVLHDQLVTVDERLCDGRVRYAATHSELRQSDLEVEKKLKELEIEIFEKAGVSPEVITDETIDPYIVRIKHLFHLSLQ